MEAPNGVVPIGTLKGHTDIVTGITSPINNGDRIVTSSRDKSVMIWRLTPGNTTINDPSAAYGYPFRRLTSHSHFVQDVVVTYNMNDKYALSASWDSDIRRWDLKTTKRDGRLVGHENDVLSVSISKDNRIVSGSRDCTMKLWNIFGGCRCTFSRPESPDRHLDWISSVRFSPAGFKVASGSWDKTVKFWDIDSKKNMATMRGHKGYVNAVAISPDGSLCASGGRDGVVIVWHLEKWKLVFELEAGSIVLALCFRPTRNSWVCAATEKSVMIWDLRKKKVVYELFSGLHEAAAPPSSSCPPSDRRLAANLPSPTPLLLRKKNERIYCTSMNWSEDGSTLFTGYTDGVIRVWRFASESN